MACEAALGGERLLRLLQLASPALPVGAYSYSEGLETLVAQGQLSDVASLQHWIEQELAAGAMRLEAAVMARVYEAAIAPGFPALGYWNQWLSALREAEELRLQSWQMGRSLYRLLLDLDPSVAPLLEACGETSNAAENFAVNFAVVYAIAAAHWQIDSRAAILGYLHSWASNLVNAGVKLIPLGQTAGQRLLLSLAPAIARTTDAALVLPEDDFGACSWGQAIACMAHETLYTRLFRS
ncbi:urease accessory protein UreF [Thermoleptolyngbya sichuanensis XZ-Cy5]|uniref:urease accessory protein UreF n=1 Tax=Thermoleptolyngbya sichuanensis TaxID=2885951 RepID=UPI00240D612C|nr:urease accessory protein UreF [Thermoleptolyngbya sichuanensis]MDG2616887.1 urease accessory protein UreF [Thermoleptolyngbya sichuanensis XZ-Cy5]